MIKVSIDKQGNVQVEVNGVKGSSCLDLTRKLEEALGNETTHREMKAEMYEQETQQQWRTNS